MEIMTKRGYIRLFSFSVALVCILAAYAVLNMNTANSYKAKLELSYQQSLNELSENLDSIETNLTKSVYSNSDKMLLEISSDLYAECTEAKGALSRLPVSQMNLGSTYKFISQASDYANYIAQKIASDKGISDEEHKNLSELLEYSKQLSDSVEAMVTICNNGGMITASNVKSESVDVNALSIDMTTAEEAFSDYPTLLYDGPFADAVLNRESSMLKGSDEITQDEARENAAQALGCNISEISFESEESGTIPCYVFTFGQKTVGVTKNGGYIAYILYGGKITQSAIDEENAVNIAKKYLSGIGYKNMSETYYMVSNNICVINFAYKKGGVTYYSDLIKVGISMNDGKVLSLEAKGYITNHSEREKFESDIPVEEAQKKLSGYLTVLDSKKCVIPKDDGTEAMCYEFHCKSTETDEEVLVYVSSQTGKEEDIMLLLYSDGGTLTK
ncbi:MAG: germination protein YpeB [Clostridiales bacterium]|nr:germination protein YpeB [Clostridiales bacterium]